MIAKGKIWFFCISLIVASLFLYIVWQELKLLDLKDENDIQNIVVEFHGMVFDILLFGVILTVFEFIMEKRFNRILEQKRYDEKVSNCLTELNDCKGWDEKEAAYKNLANLRRLNRLGIYSINLEKVYLQGVNCKGLNLEESYFNQTNCVSCNLRKINLSNSYIMSSDFSDSFLNDANFNTAVIKYTSFVNANLEKADLRGITFESKNDLKQTQDEVIVKVSKTTDFTDANLKEAVAFVEDKVAFLRAGVSESMTEQMKWVKRG